jgi:solute carrier family 35, member E1
MNIHSSLAHMILFVVIWYSISSLANIIGKQLLTMFPHPLTVTLAQLFHGWIYSIPLLRSIDIPSPTFLHSTRIYYITIIAPLAIGKLLSQLTSQISLRLVPVSYSHTVKALMPLFTVLLSRVILGERQSSMVGYTRRAHCCHMSMLLAIERTRRDNR